LERKIERMLLFEVVVAEAAEVVAGVAAAAVMVAAAAAVVGLDCLAVNRPSVRSSPLVIWISFDLVLLLDLVLSLRQHGLQHS